MKAVSFVHVDSTDRVNLLVAINQGTEMDTETFDKLADTVEAFLVNNYSEDVQRLQRQDADTYLDI